MGIILRSKHITNLLKPILIWALIIIVSSAYGQFYNGSNMTFGKNRVQYNNFLWTFYKFNDFDTYFYLNGKELAQFAARYAYKAIPEMEGKLETGLDKRIQFIIFNNLTDLKQSNIGLATHISYNTGGITHIIGSKVFLYFDGNHVNFEKQIRAAIAEVMFNQLMFGGKLGKQVKASTFSSIPQWYRIGIISYLSEEWNVDFDNHVRDGILSGRYKKINNLTQKDAVYAGHSLWRFVAMKYGRAAVTNIIHMTSVSSSIDKGFLYVIGVPFKSLIKQWRSFYLQEYEQESKNENSPENLLGIKYKKDWVYGQPHISPYGKYLAYTTNESGKYKIWLYDFLKDKKRKIFKRGVSIDTKTDYSYPLLAWHPTGKVLAFMIEDKGMPWVYFYDVETRRFTKQIIYEVQKITDMSYSDNGRFLVMSAVRQGQSDIFVFNIAASSFERITDDLYSELNPRFINNSSQIVFSSNRENDTLGKEPEIIDEVPTNFDLFVYDYKNHNPLLKRLTNSPLANETRPEYAGFNKITYLSDANGIRNVYMAVIDSMVSSVDTTIHYRYFVHSKPVTNYSRNITDYHASYRSGKNAFIYFNNNTFYIYTASIPDFDALPEIRLNDTRFMADLKKQFKKHVAKQETTEKKKEGVTTGEQTGQEQPPQEKPEKKTKMKRFEIVYQDGKGNEYIGLPESMKRKRIKGKPGYPVIVQETGESVEESGFTIPKRLNYRVSYFMNNLTTQIDFNYLNYNYQNFTGGGPIYLNAGFNVFMKVGLTDLMEDHRLIGGVRLNFSLVNNEYIFSYANLKKRLDKEIIFHRNTIEGTTGYSLVRVHTHELFYILKWPFNEALSLRGTAFYRNDMYVTLATDQISLETPTFYNNWGGFIASLVFDNTRDLGMNLYSGWRWKIFGEYHQLFNNLSRNLIVAGFDFRYYLRIHRNFIWANRISGSASLGKDNLIYYMGGVDNWMFPKFNTVTPIDYTKNYVYQTLATPMRGFNQNIRNGNRFFLINSELRFPIFQYFSKAPLGSSFLRNFQLVTFGDIGTAWNGPSPYSKENSLYTRYVSSGPLLISVEVQKEPIVGGFGFGARAHLLGYFIRADVSWGVEDYKVRKPVFYLSLSLDF
ncbi:MAG: hypothetical protein GXO86_12310 [Chlorobi bacterium]|nr:hypothetical protein [Chlorobiota bacterium]